MGPTNAATAAAAEAPTAPSLAAVKEIEATDGFGSVEVAGKSFEIAHEPPLLLMSEAAAVEEDSPEAAAVLSEFFRFTLADYKAFRRYVLDEHVGNDALVKALQDVVEAVSNRPTE